MGAKDKKALVDFEQKVFDIRDEPMPRGAWWWWFWLFFFNNPKDPKKPRQLMILWSTKNAKEIDCNNLRIKIDRSRNRSNLDGAVAAWYYDGEKMHHNFLLEQCNLSLSEKRLSSDSEIPTSFSVEGTKNKIKIGDDFEFIAEMKGKHDFAMPIYYSSNIFRNVGYTIMKLNHLDLAGEVKGEPIKGSAYFQRVFVNSPAPSWYWGIFHFENGGILTYYKPYLLGKAIKKDITLFDGEEMHEFDDINVKRLKRKIPAFLVSGENENEKIRFTVSPYSHSSWTFKKRTYGVMPNKLVYNEYPAVISDLTLSDGNSKKITLKDLGSSVGNAEHTTGLLF